MNQALLFNDPALRKACIELYGTNRHGAKFKIGQVVRFTKKFVEGVSKVYVGAVQAVNCTGEGVEYLIEGAPVLAWENELIIHPQSQCSG